jgi:hypothetical protein
MGDAAHKDHQAAVPEDRRHDGEVGQMPGAHLGIVGDEAIAGLQRLHRVLVEHEFEGDGQCPGERGTLHTDCASERPWGSRMTQAQSLGSRTMVENDVGCNVAPVSSTMEIGRLQSTSSLTASNVRISFFSRQTAAWLYALPVAYRSRPFPSITGCQMMATTSPARKGNA